MPAKAFDKVRESRSGTAVKPVKTPTPAAQEPPVDGPQVRKAVFLPHDLAMNVEAKMLELKRSGQSVSWSALLIAGLEELLERNDVARVLSERGLTGYRKNDG